MFCYAKQKLSYALLIDADVADTAIQLSGPILFRYALVGRILLGVCRIAKRKSHLTPAKFPTNPSHAISRNVKRNAR